MHFSILNFDRRFSHNNVVSTFRCILSLEQENCLDSFCPTKAILFQSQLLTNSHVCLLSKQCFACNDLKDGILIHLLMANVATINSRAACFKKYLSSAQDQSVDFAFITKKTLAACKTGGNVFPFVESICVYMIRVTRSRGSAINREGTFVSISQAQGNKEPLAKNFKRLRFRSGLTSAAISEKLALFLMLKPLRLNNSLVKRNKTKEQKKKR